MRVVYSWLKQLYPDLPPVDQLCEALTLAGCEVENLEQDPQTEEWVFDVVILANITRCQSLWGLASEIAIILDQPPPQALECSLNVSGASSLNPKRALGCSELSLLQLSADPFAIPTVYAAYLQASGFPSMNPWVDLAHIVMLECGQPMHVYDAKRLPSLDLSVRLSVAGETLKGFASGVQAPLELPEGLLCIDAQGTLAAVAGVLGEESLSVHDDTQSVLIEAAVFEAGYIRRAMKQLSCRTEAGVRFSRGVLRGLSSQALGRYCYFLESWGARPKILGYGSSSEPSAVRSIAFSPSDVSRILGVPMDQSRLRRFLECLRLTFEEQAQGFQVRVGDERPDLVSAYDLVEEFARLEGYDTMPSNLRSFISEIDFGQDERRTSELRSALTALGLNEHLYYSFSDLKMESRVYREASPTLLSQGRVALLNAKAPERSVLRRSLLPHLLAQSVRSLKDRGRGLRAFEMGLVFEQEASAVLPLETSAVAILLSAPLAAAHWSSPPSPSSADVWDILGLVHTLSERWGRSIRIDSQNAPESGDVPLTLQLDYIALHPGQRAWLYLGADCLGCVGMIHPKVLADLGTTTPHAYAVFLQAPLLDLLSHPVPHSSLSKQPSIVLDIAVLGDRAVPAGALMALARLQGGERLVGVEIFDVYQGKDLLPHQKALGFRLTFNDPQRTMTREEAVALRGSIVEAMEASYGFALRFPL